MPKVRVRKKADGLTALDSDDWLSPRAVAKLRGCTDQTVRNALARRELAGAAIHGPDGKVSGWAVMVQDANAWEPRRPGKPNDGDEE